MKIDNRRRSPIGAGIGIMAVAVAALMSSGAISSGDEPIALPPRLPTVPRESAEMISLGRDLFFDRRLSRTGQVACATCHIPEKGFSNGERIARGVDDRPGSRNVPGLTNLAFAKSFFWDGRARTLEEQALAPIDHPDEMDMRPAALAAKLNGVENDRRRFRTIFGGDATPTRIAEAVAAFERTLVVDDTPFDRYLTGDQDALGPAAKRGMRLFFGEGRCSVCHSGANQSDDKFHNIGTAPPDDWGRRKVTAKASDHGAYRTPQLRDVGRTAPYMHDGRFATLRDVVEHYNFGGVTEQQNDHRDQELRVLYLSEDQVADLVAFLERGLTRPANEPK